MDAGTRLEKAVEKQILENHHPYMEIEMQPVIEEVVLVDIQTNAGRMVSVNYEEYILLKQIRRLALCVSLKDPEYDKFMVKLQDCLAEYFNRFEKGHG